MRKRIVFFDIDGTLIDSSDSGRAAFVNALHSVFGWTDSIDYIEFSGATDLDVLSRIFEHYGRKLTEADTELFFEALPQELERTCALRQPTALAGVLKLLESLAQIPDTLVGLITGNIETCARVKLAAAGIDHKFVLGAFGHEHADRNEIARLGLKRAERMLDSGDSIGEVFVIGDSPADVAAAKAIGARSIAVCTGRPTCEDLVAAGADVILKDLSEAAQLDWNWE